MKVIDGKRMDLVSFDLCKGKQQNPAHGTSPSR